MKYLKITLLTLFVLSLASFKTLQTLQNDKEFIIGTWIPEGCLQCKWVFIENGTLYSYIEGNIYKTYTYTIDEESSANGKLTLSTLRIKNIDNPNDTYEYDINGISETVMYLDYLGDLNTNLSKYTKQ